MRKGLLNHINPVKTPSEDESNASNSKVNDMKAFAINSTMISPNLQSMVTSACSAAQSWDILKKFFLRRSLHNIIQKKRELHEFKMKKGGSVMDRFLRFDELCVSTQAIGAFIALDEQLVVLLGSMSEDFDQIIKIMENVPGMDMFQAKEMLLRESESISAKESMAWHSKRSTSVKVKVEQLGRTGTYRTSRGSVSGATSIGTNKLL
uniref:Putative polyprotein n=1 Tax=Albugo laibachii Nc14 TaxID=890382 RepID=F0W7U7_9STRA|nr:putative polyprotein [Albugo laibachii Nc14]|eukprot:CCA17199.1 putative polyprotein [Albugo laibachii Nc14]